MYRSVRSSLNCCSWLSDDNSLHLIQLEEGSSGNADASNSQAPASGDEDGAGELGISAENIFACRSYNL